MLEPETVQWPQRALQRGGFTRAGLVREQVFLFRLQMRPGVKQLVWKPAGRGVPVIAQMGRQFCLQGSFRDGRLADSGVSDLRCKWLK